MHAFFHSKRIHETLLYSAYGWLLLSGLLQFVIDVISQAIRGKRTPGAETNLYYGLNSAYALSQILFALLALFAIRQVLSALGRWPGITLGLFAASAWLTICLRFLEYSQPPATVFLFVVLLLGARFTA
ncbi:hypothetical protein [Silvibacterium acidisoli]|uniref:hypothetical protein n=1 Tax=Acidobacteriaceae bacterium ZG23-2 TaxID=2883246 RepID=UPI00406C2156